MKARHVVALTLAGLLGARYVTPSAAAYSSSSYLCEVQAAPAARKTVAASKASSSSSFTSSNIQPAPENHHPNTVEGNVLTIYYTTNSNTMYDNDIKDLNGFIRAHPEAKSFVFEGYADFRGGIEDNLALANNRAKGAVHYARGANRSAKMSVVSYGEEKAQAEGTDKANLWKDRKVRVYIDKSVIGHGLDLLVSDFYLVDQSGSMNNPLESEGEEVTKWEQVQQYQFPAGAKVYTFTDRVRTCGTSLRTEQPQGGTPLYSSLAYLVEKVPYGKSITVLTDGEDTEGGSINQVTSSAKTKGVKISFVGVGLETKNQATIAEIATQTGGKVYFTEK